LKEDKTNITEKIKQTDNESLSAVEAKVSLLPTHADLVKIAERWLYKTMGCGVVFTELVTMADETPDAFGLRSDYTILVECKTSKADFFADQKKRFRKNPEEGIGDYRFYLCPKDLISPNELPSKWGLLYFDGKKVKKIKAPKGNIASSWIDFKFDKSERKELRIMYSALRRIHLRGHLGCIYETPDSYYGQSS
jgi:hypothetical protein